jgi:hypothetical protein
MDVDKFMERAEAALRKRAPDQAIALYRQVLTARPGNGPARRGLMAAYRKRAELKGGASMLDAPRPVAARGRDGLRSSALAGAGQDLRRPGEHPMTAVARDAGRGSRRRG